MSITFFIKIKEVEENITSATKEAPLTLLCKILTFKYDCRADQKQDPWICIRFYETKGSDSLGGAARNLRCKLSTSSSTGMLSSPHLCPRWVGAILTHTSLLPDALTPSSKLANRESLQAHVQTDSAKCTNDQREWHRKNTLTWRSRIENTDHT